jgi:hypothetical protein
LAACLAGDATAPNVSPSKTSDRLPFGGFVRFVPALLVVSALVPVTAPAQAQTREDLRARRATVPPKIDGVLDDELWSSDPLPLDRWMSYNPLRGEPEQQRTSVWIGYDNEAIYFAFRCYDAEPDRIRSDRRSAGATTCGMTTGSV